MSYAISLECPTCGSEPVDTSITSNLAPMWRAAGLDLRDFDGYSAEDFAPHLVAALRELETHPDIYRSMNPENGWGDYDGLLAAFHSLYEECRRVPTARLSVSH